MDGFTTFVHKLPNRVTVSHYSVKHSQRGPESGLVRLEVVDVEVNPQGPIRLKVLIHAGPDLHISQHEHLVPFRDLLKELDRLSHNQGAGSEFLGLIRRRENSCSNNSYVGTVQVFDYEVQFVPALARSLLELQFRQRAIDRMNTLAEQNQKGTLTEAERSELDRYLRVGCFLNLIQAKARKSLPRRS